MQSYYKPIGDSKQGYKLTIPAIVKKADLYKFEQSPKMERSNTPRCEHDPNPAAPGQTYLFISTLENL